MKIYYYSNSLKKQIKKTLNCRIKLMTRSIRGITRIEVLKLEKLLERTNKQLIQNRIIEILKLKPE